MRSGQALKRDHRRFFCAPFFLSWLLLSACASSAPPTARHSIADVDRDDVVTWDDARSAQALSALLSVAPTPPDLARLQAEAGQAMARAGQPVSIVLLTSAKDPQLGARLHALAPARCARDASGQWVLCSRARVDFLSAPSHLEVGERLHVRGRLLGASRVHSGLLQGPDQAITALDVRLEGRDFFLRSAAELGAGLFRVELLVTTEQGREVAALWWLVVGRGRAPAPLVDEPDAADFPVGDAGELEGGAGAHAARRHFAQLNQDRRAAGRAPLTWSPSLAKAARARARALTRVDRLQHSAPQALRELGDDKQQPYSWVAENLARARSVQGARRAIMLSPAHFANCMQAEARVGGVGAAWQGQGTRRTLFIVSLLGRPSSTQDPQTMAAEIYARVSAAWRAGGLPVLLKDPDLAARARAHAAKSCAAQRLLKHDPQHRPLAQSILQTRPDLQSANASLLSRLDVDDWIPEANMLRPDDNLIGIGAQKCDTTRTWYLVIFTAEAPRP